MSWVPSLRDLANIGVAALEELGGDLMGRGPRLGGPGRYVPPLNPEWYPGRRYALPVSEVARVAIEWYYRATELRPRHAPEEAMRVAERAADCTTDDADTADEISKKVVLAYHRHLSALPPYNPATDYYTPEELAEELAIAEVDEADRDWLGRGRYER